MGQMSTKKIFFLFSLSQNLFQVFLFYSFFFLHEVRGLLALESKYFVSVFVENIQNWVKGAKIGQKIALMSLSQNLFSRFS